MPVYHYCNRSYLKVYRVKRFTLVGEEELVGEQAGVAVEGALGGDAGKFGKIIAFREMGEDNVGGLAVVGVFEEVGRGLVGEVTDARKYPLFHGPGVGAVAEHFEVVVGFEEEEVEGFELGFDVGGDVAEVGGDGEAEAF